MKSTKTKDKTHKKSVKEVTWVDGIPGKRESLPPDPEGHHARCTKRAKKIVDLYQKLDPGTDLDNVVTNLVYDLYHLADRLPDIGNVDERSVRGLYYYAEDIWETYAENGEPFPGF